MDGRAANPTGEDGQAGDDDDGSSSNLSADPEFEEDLKQFSLRLQQQSSMLSSARSTGRFRKLRPNVSDDWLLCIKELSGSICYSPMPSPSPVRVVSTDDSLPTVSQFAL